MRFAWMWGMLFAAPEALACPRCYTAKIVRATVFSDGFWSQLLVLAAPLVILVGISAALYGVGLRAKEDET